VVNVYSKCDLPAKRRLWDRLVELRRSMGEGAWCILGDFNLVCRSGERRGVNEEVNPSQREEIILFNTFLREVDLEDLNLLGRRFTWFHPNGRAMSRIDRVLTSEEWANLWGDSSLWVLPRDVSDHCPLILKEAGWDWGPRPFRFNNHWLENSDFKKVVEEAWGGLIYKDG
jgi:exonuclease III